MEAAWLCIGQLAGGVAACAGAAVCDVVCPIIKVVEVVVVEKDALRSPANGTDIDRRTFSRLSGLSRLLPDALLAN